MRENCTQSSNTFCGQLSSSPSFSSFFFGAVKWSQSDCVNFAFDFDFKEWTNITSFCTAPTQLQDEEDWYGVLDMSTNHTQVTYI